MNARERSQISLIDWFIAIGENRNVYLNCPMGPKAISFMATCVS